MKQTLILLSTFLTLNLFGQKSDIENLINQVAKAEVPENFKYYFLVPESLEETKVYDSLQNYEIRELKMTDKNIPVHLIDEKTEETVSWNNYDLKKVKYVPNERIAKTSPPISKKVRFFKYKIEQKEYDSLVKNREPHTLIIKKKWFWNKHKIWDNNKFHAELKKAWRIDRERNIEEKIYFQFSKPIFSKDGKYAKISVFKNWRCNGRGFTALYKNNDGKWKKLIEFNEIARKVSMTHSRCEDISIWYD